MRIAILLCLTLAFSGCSQSRPPKLAILTIRTFRNDEAGHRDEVVEEVKQTLKAPFVIKAALRVPELADVELLTSQAQPSKWLARNIRTYDFDDGTFAISLPAAPQDAGTAKVINALTNCLLDEYAQDHRNKMAARIYGLRQMNLALSDQLKELTKDAPERKTVERMVVANQTELSRLNV